jgi:hypothetical protein
MPGYLARLRRLGRNERRSRIEEALHARLTTIDDQPLVASLLAGMRCDGFRVTHLTYDDPDVADSQASLQFTYHLQDGAEGEGIVDHDEIRGSGMASFDDEGVVHLSEVDGDIFRQRGAQWPEPGER